MKTYSFIFKTPNGETYASYIKSENIAKDASDCFFHASKFFGVGCELTYCDVSYINISLFECTLGKWYFNKECSDLYMFLGIEYVENDLENFIFINSLNEVFKCSIMSLQIFDFININYCVFDYVFMCKGTFNAQICLNTKIKKSLKQYVIQNQLYNWVRINNSYVLQVLRNFSFEWRGSIVRFDFAESSSKWYSCILNIECPFMLAMDLDISSGDVCFNNRNAIPMSFIEQNTKQWGVL